MCGEQRAGGPALFIPLIPLFATVTCSRSDVQRDPCRRGTKHAPRFRSVCTLRLPPSGFVSCTAVYPPLYHVATHVPGTRHRMRRRWLSCSIRPRSEALRACQQHVHLALLT
jgi:hypothetical protein